MFLLKGSDEQYMPGGGWQKSWVRVLTTLLTLAIMIIIFCFSTQNADRSDRTSGYFSMKIIRLLWSDYDSRSAEEQKDIYDNVQHVIRKCAHFWEYTMLGFMIRLCLESWFGAEVKRRKALLLIAFAIGVVYAASDEIHQLLIDGRSGQWTDVLLDSCGVMTGVLLGIALIWTTYRRKEEEVKN